MVFQFKNCKFYSFKKKHFEFSSNRDSMEKSMDSFENIDLSAIFREMRPRNICTCHAVSEKTLIDTIRSGVHDLTELTLQTGASTKCGSCLKTVSKIYYKEMQILEDQKEREIE
jgi:bacterioferritin-associated ferredoxin